MTAFSSLNWSDLIALQYYFSWHSITHIVCVKLYIPMKNKENHGRHVHYSSCVVYQEYVRRKKVVLLNLKSSGVKHELKRNFGVSILMRDSCVLESVVSLAFTNNYIVIVSTARCSDFTKCWMHIKRQETTVVDITSSFKKCNHIIRIYFYFVLFHCRELVWKCNRFRRFF